jgi:hypothetical protein
MLLVRIPVHMYYRDMIAVTRFYGVFRRGAELNCNPADSFIISNPIPESCDRSYHPPNVPTNKENHEHLGVHSGFEGEMVSLDPMYARLYCP